MKRKLILMLVSLMLVLSTAACGKQIDSSTVNEEDSDGEIEKKD